MPEAPCLASLVTASLSYRVRPEASTAATSGAPTILQRTLGVAAREEPEAEAEAWEIFNMGCGFVAVVPEAHAEQATRILASHHPGTRRIGTVTDEAGRASVAGGRYSSGQGSRSGSS